MISPVAAAVLETDSLYASRIAEYCTPRDLTVSSSVPYSVMKYHFPVLQKHRYLLPFAYIVRMIRPIFDGRLKRYLREWELNRNMSKEESNQTQTFLKNIGL